jgi:hypothetical protein
VEFNSTKPRVPFDLSNNESISQQRASKAPLKKNHNSTVADQSLCFIKTEMYGKNERVMRVAANGKLRVVSVD